MMLANRCTDDSVIGVHTAQHFFVLWLCATHFGCLICQGSSVVSIAAFHDFELSPFAPLPLTFRTVFASVQCVKIKLILRKHSDCMKFFMFSIEGIFTAPRFRELSLMIDNVLASAGISLNEFVVVSCQLHHIVSTALQSSWFEQQSGAPAANILLPLGGNLVVDTTQQEHLRLVRVHIQLSRPGHFSILVNTVAKNILPSCMKFYLTWMNHHSVGLPTDKVARQHIFPRRIAPDPKLSSLEQCDLDPWIVVVDVEFSTRRDRYFELCTVAASCPTGRFFEDYATVTAGNNEVAVRSVVFCNPMSLKNCDHLSLPKVSDVDVCGKWSWTCRTCALVETLLGVSPNTFSNQAPVMSRRSTSSFAFIDKAECATHNITSPRSVYCPNIDPVLYNTLGVLSVADYCLCFSFDVLAQNTPCAAALTKKSSAIFSEIKFGLQELERIEQQIMFYVPSEQLISRVSSACYAEERLLLLIRLLLVRLPPPSHKVQHAPCLAWPLFSFAIANGTPVMTKSLPRFGESRFAAVKHCFTSTRSSHEQVLYDVIVYNPAACPFTQLCFRWQ